MRYSSDLYGGDITSFVRQGWAYRLFDTSKFFMKSLAEYEAIDAIKKGLGKFPAGLYSATMYTSTFPDTKANHEFNDAHVKRFGVASPPLDVGRLQWGVVIRRSSQEGQDYRDRGSSRRPERPIGSGADRHGAERDRHDAQPRQPVDLLRPGLGNHHIRGTLSERHRCGQLERDARRRDGMAQKEGVAVKSHPSRKESSASAFCVWPKRKLGEAISDGGSAKSR